MSPRIAVRTLGTVAIDIGERRIGPSSGRLFALVLYLASRRGHPIPRRVVQELLFSAGDRIAAAHSLRQLLYRLRQLGAPIETDLDQILLSSEEFSIDCYDIAEGRALVIGELEVLAEGLFPGYLPEISDAFREWFEAERAELSLRLSRAVATRLLELRRAGRWDQVDIASRALLALDPFSEEGTLAKAEALAVSGSKTAALSVIDQYLQEVGDGQPHLRVAPAALKRRICERLPESIQRLPDDRLFVGREDSMQTLSVLGAVSRSSRQQVLLMWGEPGVGKTRLLTEYRALSSLQGGITRLLVCRPHDVFRPLGVLFDLVGELLDAPGALGCDPSARQFLERLANVRGNVGAAPENVGEEVPLSAIVRCLTDLISAVSAESPVVVLIDDIQWLDQASLRGLLGVFSGGQRTRSLLIMTSRSRASWASADRRCDNFSSFRLRPLEREPSLELTRTLLRTSARDDAEIESRVLEQAKGNPFFIRLLCSHFLSTNDANFLRKTISEVLERRLEQLTTGAMHALQACVTLGKNCSFARLEELLQLPRYVLLSAIEELDDQGLVQIDGGVIRSHDLLADVVESRMSRSVYRAIHAAAASLLQRDWTSTRIGSIPWDCAEHWRLAGDNENAVAALRTCAERSMDMGRPSDALITLKRALCFDTSDSTRLEITEDALAALWLGVNWTGGDELVSELKRLRQRLGQVVSQHDKSELVELSLAMHSDGDPRPNVERLIECITSTTSTLGHKLFAARHLIMIAELTLSRDVADCAFQLISKLEPGGYWLAFSEMLYHTIFGDATLVPGLVERLEPVVELPRLLLVLLNLGYAQYRVGDCRDAESTLLRAVGSAQQFEIASAELHAVLLLARMHWSLGGINESSGWHRRFTELLTRNNQPNVFWEHTILGARLATLSRNFEEARQYIEMTRRCRQAELDLPQLFLLACETDLRIAAGEDPCSDAELERFLSLHRRARNLGLQDEVTLALLRVLELRGEVETALHLFECYVTSHRRDRFPLYPELLTVGHRLGCEEQRMSATACKLGGLADSPLRCEKGEPRHWGCGSLSRLEETMPDGAGD